MCPVCIPCCEGTLDYNFSAIVALKVGVMLACVATLWRKGMGGEGEEGKGDWGGEEDTHGFSSQVIPDCLFRKFSYPEHLICRQLRCCGYESDVVLLSFPVPLPLPPPLLPPPKSRYTS